MNAHLVEEHLMFSDGHWEDKVAAEKEKEPQNQGTEAQTNWSGWSTRYRLIKRFQVHVEKLTETAQGGYYKTDEPREFIRDGDVEAQRQSRELLCLGSTPRM